MIFIWRMSSEIPEKLVALCQKEGDLSSLRKARALSASPVARFDFGGSISQLNELEYLPNSAALPVVRSEIGDRILRLCGATMQIFPCAVECEDTVQIWSLLNPLESVGGVIWQLSDALVIPGTTQVMKFRSLRLLPDTLVGLHVARLREFMPFILVSAKFRSLFQGGDGCEFIDPAELRA